jgi:enediyne biosynthesis protein E4
VGSLRERMRRARGWIPARAAPARLRRNCNRQEFGGHIETLGRPGDFRGGEPLRHWGMGKEKSKHPAASRLVRLGVLALLAAAAGVGVLERSGAEQSPASAAPGVPVRFTNIRSSAGINFLQDSTDSAQKYYLETMGTGVGWLDYDQDGLMDLYFVQAAATDAYQPSRPLRSALYHNNGDGTFTDVTEKAGVGGAGHYGQGVAVGDFDNDGYPDLYVTGYGRAILYHNNGDGTFTDVTAQAGVADQGIWSTSAGWFDYDKDGWLDLLVCNYLDWTPQTNIWCGEHRPGYRAYCNPNNYRGEHLSLFHNNHDGTFTDVSDASGVSKPEAKGMGVVLADFNNDGWPDIAVANDTWPNFFFLNHQDGTFQDVSFISGVAASEDGRYEAGMGIDAADVDGDGWLDLYITHLDFELNRLYHNNHDGTFDDDTYPSGIGNKAILMSGVAMKFLDYDNDGWEDILQANGAMLDNIHLYHSEVSYQEPLLMFRNLGKGHFDKVSDSLGPDFLHPVVGRGLATADFDNDGDTDVAVVVRGDYPELLRNDGGNANHWLTVKLVGTRSNRDGVGAVLKLTAQGFTQTKQAKGGTSYMSASDPRIHFGLGRRSTIDSLEITWPSGQVDHLTKLPLDQIITVREGQGLVPGHFPKIPSR